MTQGGDRYAIACADRWRVDLCPELDADAWFPLGTELRARQRTAILPCCQAEARLRVRQWGTQHFVHKRRHQAEHQICHWQPETYEHLATKTALVSASRTLGYTADTEVTGPGWRADVLVTNGHWRVALEVQWSPQTLTETEARQARYAADGVRGCWFFRTPPPEVRFATEVAGPHLPHFQLIWASEQGQALVALYDSYIPISVFVQALLNGESWRDLLIEDLLQRVTVVFFPLRCWNCKGYTQAYYVADTYTACCTVRARHGTRSLLRHLPGHVPNCDRRLSGP